MFTCRACTRRLLTAAIEHALPSEPVSNPLRPSIKISTSTHQTRSFATATTSAVQPVQQTSWDAEEKESKALEWAANKQLQYLQDPYHIANHILATLEKGRYEEAKLTVLKASKKKNVVVSWNHLINYQMRQQNLPAAIKLFNEMRKRAQMPTAYTYTIMFRGLAQASHTKLAVAEAVKLYNNMLKSDRIKPNTQHYNCVLQVCAKAGDLDTMFTIVRSAHDRDRPPDNFTYTTILNGLRAKAEIGLRHQPRKQHSAPVDEETKQTIQRAKAIWEEVLAKWRSASLVIDEQLVCAMGRILLMGSDADNESVLSLVEQTMGIPKDEEALIKLAREAHLAPPENDVRQRPSGLALRRKPGGNGTNPDLSTRPEPGNNTLSVVLAALQHLTKTSLAPRYWDVFTRRYGVNPDAKNWHQLLRSLRYGHNSGKVAEYLWIMPKSFMSEATFRIAMNACLRDNLNKHAFHNGCQVFEVMITSLRAPDPHAMRIYLQLAYAVKRPFEDQAKKDPEAAKLAYGKQLVTALENLWGPYRIATKQFAFGGLTRTPPLPPPPASPPTAAAAATTTTTNPPTTKTTTTSDIGLEMWKLHATAMGEISALARKMIAAYDRLIFGDLATAETIAKLKPRRNQINAFVVKYFKDREEYEPAWRFRKPEKQQRQKTKEDEDEEDDMEFLEGSEASRSRVDDVW